MNKAQAQTTAASLIGIFAGYAAGQGWFGLSAGDWTTLLGALVTIGSVAWPIFANRAQALKDAVGKMKDTTVVTSKESADALPDNPDVIAATPEVVAAIKKAS